MYDGVDRGKLGRVVATVADAEAKKDETTSGDSIVALAGRSGYNPIIGTSFVLMP